MIDSSVFVRYLSREEGWEELERYLIKPVTIPLALKEVANALRTKTLDGNMDAGDAKQMIAKVTSLVRLVPQEGLIAESYQIAVEHRITVYDALFIAAALHEKQELITCDEEQARIGRKLALKVRMVE